jgi:putative ABC transport system permease protein
LRLTLAWIDDLLRDVAYGARMLRNAPLVSFAVVVTLTIGIGLDTGAFTVLNGLLLRPRCESNPETFARLYAEYSVKGTARDFGGQFSAAAYETMARESRVLAQLAAWRTDAMLVEDDASRSLALEVSCNFFQVYGLTQPRAGRLFRPDECSRDATNQVVVIAEEMWRDRFAADPRILGKTILLNRLPFTVIGIAPLDFSGRVRGPGLWIPLGLQGRVTGKPDIFHSENRPTLWLEGRLARGRTRRELSSEANVIAAQFPSDARDLKTSVDVTDGSLIDDPNARSSASWIILLVISGLTLLLAVSCATTAVLLLARAAQRRREIAIRISLGAARSRVLRQLIAENLLLAAAAGVMGIYVALEVPQVLKKLVARMPHFPFTLDWHIFGYLAAITLGASVLAGLAPALECLRQDVWASLKGSEASVHAGKARWSIRDLLVMTQVCFSVVLMVASAMYVRLELDIIDADPGFEAEQVLQVPVQLPANRYGPAAASDFYAKLRQQLEALPAVQSVAVASVSPLGGDLESTPDSPRFRTPAQGPEEARGVTVRSVSANYFQALGMPLLRGEAFRNSPGDEDAAVVSQAFASAFWPGRDPIGQTVIGPGDTRLRILGIVRDTRTEYFSQPDGPCIYLLRRTAVPGDFLLLRFHGDAATLQVTIKTLVHDLDPQMFVLSTTLRAAIHETAEQFWMMGKMLLFVALVAAGLALFGIYGVVGYSVTRRTREFGIRAALGASRRELMRLVFASGSRPVVAGILAGLLLAIIFMVSFATALRNSPVALPAQDPLPYAFVCALLLIAAAAAMLGHALRAARIEPLVALREQ